MSILIMVFVGQSLEITGDSMFPTLVNGERVVVEKVTYKSRQPERGEIVVFRSLQNDRTFLIKRVIAIPGDTLSFEDGKVIVNGGVLNEYYLKSQVTMVSTSVLDKYSDTPLPKGNYVVMGDNRMESFDSRMFGLVPSDKFVGKAFIVYWPPKDIRKI